MDDEKPTLIWELEKSGHHLRNITFTSIPKGESDFNLIMPVAEQERWLQDLRMVETIDERVIEPELRRKYRRKYEQFLQLPHADQAINVLKAYARCGIPAFRRGEVSFWCVSCMLGRGVYARINIHLQDVLTVFVGDDELWLSLHMADSPFTLPSDEAVALLFERHPALEVREHQYKPGGPDQVNFALPTSSAGPFFLTRKYYQRSVCSTHA